MVKFKETSKCTPGRAPDFPWALETAASSTLRKDDWSLGHSVDVDATSVTSDYNGRDLCFMVKITNATDHENTCNRLLKVTAAFN